MDDGCCLLDLDGRAVPLRIRRHKRARRMILRLDPQGDGVLLTLPAGVPLAQAKHFAESKGGWILDHLTRRPSPRPFVDGAEIPLRGEPHRLCHRPGARGSVWCLAEAQEIHVAGDAAHLSRRLHDWLRAEARRDITTRAASICADLGRSHGRITLRDPRSRWGSCAHNGNLSFSWRLILAPEAVLDYVVAHEVAHLSIRDHGPRFHALVARLTEHATSGRAWLKRHGRDLHLYG
ncbi:SprT family zinc-dependent metalloprotease [Magnetospira thiophila]